MNEIDICNRVISQLEKIERRLDDIDKRLDGMESSLKNIQDSGKNMDTHIEFVETVYSSVKSPFHYIMDRISSIPYVTFTEPRVIKSD